jgi:uncharacterized membrane protein
MLSYIKSRLSKIYFTIIRSIAFYPSLILIGFIAFAIILLYLERRFTNQWLLDNAEFLVIDNVDTARALLGTSVGGIISLMVFSFSMVMMTLNQASSNFSPRLLPGLVSDKRNQSVLGFNLGTIIYNIIVMMNVRPDENAQTINGFTILVGIILSIICLILFVFFIHGISNSIQINNILDRIFRNTKNSLSAIIDAEEQQYEYENGQDINWKSSSSDEAGYFQGVNRKGLLEACDKKGVQMKVIPVKGEYLLPKEELFAVDKKLSDEDIEDLKKYFIFSNNYDASDNYVLGMKQITDVGLKAMSPGINDPGTAIMTIEYLTELIALRMRLRDMELYKEENRDQRILIQAAKFESVLYSIMASYRQYCKHDVTLMRKLLWMLRYLLSQTSACDHYYDDIKNQISILKEDIKDNVSNSTDRKKLFEMIDDIESPDTNDEKAS